MTSAVRELLDTFDALTPPEKHDAAIQVLRRVVDDESGAVPDESLVLAAEELFLDLDAREALNGQS